MGSFASGLAAAPKTNAYVPAAFPPRTEGGGHGVFGFFGNLAGDVGELVGGLYRFLATGVSEAVTQPTNVLKEFGTLGFADTPVSVLTPAVVPHMAGAIVADVKDRYLEGDIGQELYDNPLSFLLDATAVAGAAGITARAATGTGAVAGRLGKYVLGTERVAKNAELLSNARALRLAQTSEDAAKVSELLETLGPNVRKAKALDALVTKPFAIADPTSGATFDILPTRNPLISAVWSEPVRRKYFMEGLSQFEGRVDDLRRIVEDTGGTSQSINELNQMESALRRMKAEGAEYVAGKQYGTVMMRSKMKGATDHLLGRLQMRGILDRRRQREGLRQIIRTSGASPETLERALSVMEGLDETVPMSMDPVALLTQVQAKGFSSLEEAADRMLRHDPMADVLDVDERNGLGSLVLGGQLDPLQGFRAAVDATIEERTGLSEFDLAEGDLSPDSPARRLEGNDRKIERLNELYKGGDRRDLEAFTDLPDGIVRYQRPGQDRAIYLATEDVEVPVEDYRFSHRPNEGGPRAFDLFENGDLPDDIYDNPQYYVGDPDSPAAQETIAALRAIRDKPDAEVTIYRAAPEGSPLNEGDWVTLSKTYATQHGFHADDPSLDLPVMEQKVRARDIRFAGDDLNEFGYFPERTPQPTEAELRARYEAEETPRVEPKGLRQISLETNGQEFDTPFGRGRGAGAGMYATPEGIKPHRPYVMVEVPGRKEKVNVELEAWDPEVDESKLGPEGRRYLEEWEAQKGGVDEAPDVHPRVREVTAKAKEMYDAYQAAVDETSEVRAAIESKRGKLEYATATERKKFDAKLRKSSRAIEKLVKYLDDNVAPPEGAGSWGDVRPTDIRDEIRKMSAPEPTEAPAASLGPDAVVLDGVDQLLGAHQTWPNSKGVIEETWTDKADLVRRLKSDLKDSGSGGGGRAFVQADARGIQFESGERVTWSKVADALIRRRDERVRAVGAADDVADQAEQLPAIGQEAARRAGAVESDPDAMFDGIDNPPEIRREVVGYRDTKGSTGQVFHTAVRSDRIRQGIGERLHRAHWADQGITTPERILAALGENRFTPEAAALNKKVANELAESFQPTYHDALASLDLGARRRRPIDEVDDVSADYPDGRDVRQTVKGAGNLRRVAIEAIDTLGSQLSDIFGPKSVVLHLKDESKIIEAMEEGSRVLDAAAARVVIDNWQGTRRSIQAMQEGGMEIVGVEDFRRVPGSGGARGTRVYVNTPLAEGGSVITEVEIGTPLFHRFRESTHAHDRRLSRLHRDLRKAEEHVARLAGSTNPNQAGVQQSIDEAQRLVDSIAAEVSAGDRYMEGHYEMLADEIASHHGRTIPDTQMRELVNEFRLWVARELETDLIESATWDWDFQYAFERLYLPARLKSGAQWDEEVGDFVGGESVYTIDDARARAGLLLPVYFPHLEPPGSLTDFITPRKGQGQKKLAENRNLRRSRGSLFEAGNYITDIEEAYARRAARAIKMRDTYEMIASVSKKFGRKLESADDLLPGESLIAPQFLQAFVKLSIGIEDRLGRLVAEMSDDDMLRAVENLNPDMARQMAPDILAEGIRGALGVDEREAGALFLAVSEAMPKARRDVLAVSKQGLELYAVPKIVGDRLTESARWNLGPNARIFWDKPTQLWRAMTLYGRPAWVVNNILGNVVFSKIGGVRLREITRIALDRQYRYYVDELARVYGQGDVLQGWMSSSDFYTPQLGVAEETLQGRAMAKLEAKGRESRVLKPFRKYADGIKRLNTEVENLFRKAGFVEGLRKGDVLRDTHRTARGFWGSKDELQRMLADGISPEKAQRALDKMQTWFGDYSSMSPFERQIVRRFIFPFWGFYKHMGKLLVKLPFDYPFKTQVMYAMSIVDRDLREDYGAVPSWMEGMVPFGPASPDGMQKFLSVSGPNPFNVFMDVGLGLFHPALKATVEMMTGRDAYTGREFSDPDVFTPYGSTQRYRIVRGPDGVPVDAVPIDKVTPPVPVELLSQIPQYDWLRSALAGGKPYDTAGLIGSATQGPVTSASGEPISPFSGGDLLARSLGATFYDYDIEGFRARQAQERENALTQAYERWAEQRVGSPVGVG